jgi:hypothetical protein
VIGQKPAQYASATASARISLPAAYTRSPLSMRKVDFS